MKYQKQPGWSDAPAAQPGRWIQPEPSDRYRYANTSRYTPARLGEIVTAANAGDTEQICICARDILERNWDIIGALDQRAEALLGVKWEVLPGGSGPNDKAAAEAFRAELEGCGSMSGLDTFYDLVRTMEDAVVYPFAVSEIVWEPGGRIRGFQRVDPWHFTLRDSYEPLLISDEHPNGEKPERYKCVIHQSRKAADPARSGRIRVLAWLHLFQNWPIKDLFSFVERFGMPFVVAKVDRQTWDEELHKIQGLIKGFGPSGGGVFSQGTDVQLLQAANTGSDSIYLKILEYTREAIYRLLLGQTASSSGGGGLSGDTAQSEVRQDILESDARAVEATIYAQIAAPWTGFNFGPSAAVPRIHFKVEPPEDMAAFTTMLQGVYNSGFLADPAEVGKKVGLALTLKPEPSQGSGMGFGLQTPAEAATPAADPKALQEARGIAIRAGLLTPTAEIEAQTRRELGLPEMPEEVKKAWEATGGIRQPITLKPAESAAVDNALDVDDKAAASKTAPDAAPLAADPKKKSGEPDKPGAANPRFVRVGFEEMYNGGPAARDKKTPDPDALADEAAAEVINGGVLESWLGPFAEAVTELSGETDDETFKKRLKKLADEPPFGDSAGFEKTIFREAVTGIKGGK